MMKLTFTKNLVLKTFAAALSLSFVMMLCMALVKPIDQPTILAAGIFPKVSRPGQDLKITYNWDAVPMDKNYSVWVHIKDASGATVFQNDHEPPFPTETSTWSGKFSYTQTVFVPDTLKSGIYSIVAGLYFKTDRHELTAGPDVKVQPGLGYEIGKFTVDPKAPIPPLASDKKVTLDLKGYEISFKDDFRKKLDVSPLGSGTKWIAHTPYGGDFGDAQFSNPEEGFPFTIVDGLLVIEAKKEGGKWRSGLLSSLDTANKGFSQLYGYFEMRAKLPVGPGTWPAFWLLKSPKAKMGFEVDILEQYGKWPDVLHTALHWWYPDKTHKGVGDNFRVEDMSRQFHTYGFLWTKEEMIWYFDGKELWRKPTPAEANEPMYVLIDLAVGSGWPTNETPNPSIMVVDYVKVYKKVAK